MQSSKYQYRVVTAAQDKFRVQFKSKQYDVWTHLAFEDTLDAATATVVRNIENDDHEGTVVDIDGANADYHWNKKKANIEDAI